MKSMKLICATILSLSLVACGGGDSDAPQGDFYAVNFLKDVPSACVNNLGAERGDAVGLNLTAYYGTRQAGANISFSGEGSCTQYAVANNIFWGAILTADQYRNIVLPAVRR